MIKTKFVKHHAIVIFFFLTSFFGYTNCLMYKKIELVYSYIYLPSVVDFSKYSGRICPRKLEIAMFFYMNNTFQQDSVFNEMDYTWISQIFSDIPRNFHCTKNELFHSAFLQEMWPNPHSVLGENLISVLQHFRFL